MRRLEVRRLEMRGLEVRKGFLEVGYGQQEGWTDLLGVTCP